MGQALFYHLTQRPLDATLSQLLQRSLGRGWQVFVRTSTSASLTRLDRMLWGVGGADGFFAHGLQGGPYDALQPVLLGISMQDAGQPANKAQCLMSVEGAEVSIEEAAAFERVCILFDGHDGAAVSQARAQWSSLTKAGISAQYWSEESGKWQMKIEK
jgi:DNA polymerase-3 subunit chi